MSDPTKPPTPEPTTEPRTLKDHIVPGDSVNHKPIMKIYLAARYSRREELCEYRTQLEALGHAVTSRWLNGKHQIDNTGKPIGDQGESLVEDDDNSTDVKSIKLRESFAREDFADVVRADLLIAFTEVPRSGHSRGGRHVELGIALGRMKQVYIVGPRENIFCWLPEVFVFETFQECLHTIGVGEWSTPKEKL